MSSFRRKSYGRVKPVPKAKEKAPVRPAVNELKAIFKNIQTSPAWQTCDYLSQALIWWTNSISYIGWKYRKMYPLASAKAFDLSQEAIRRGWNANNDKEKVKNFVEALTQYARFAAGAGLKIPPVQPYLKKSKEVTKKTKEVNKKLAVRFDPVLTLLSQCFKSCNLGLVVNDYIKDKITGNQLDRKFDHQLNRMYYSRAHCVEMKRTIHREGLLTVVLQEADHLARGMAFFGEDEKTGKFLADPKKWHTNYTQLLKDFTAFAHTTKAPKTLVRREKIAKKKKASKEEIDKAMEDFVY